MIMVVTIFVVINVLARKFLSVDGFCQLLMIQEAIIIMYGSNSLDLI